MATAKPSAANRRAAAAPMPDPPAVITATFCIVPSVFHSFPAQTTHLPEAVFGKPQNHIGVNADGLPDIPKAFMPNTEEVT